MDLTCMLLLLLVQSCSAVSLEEIAESLQEVQTFLRNDKESKIVCWKTDDMKSQLQDYIHSTINEYFKNKVNAPNNVVNKDDLILEVEHLVDDRLRKVENTERVLQAFASEKRIRKEIENEIRVAQNFIQQNEATIKNIKADFSKLEKDKKELKISLGKMQKDLQSLNSRKLDSVEILKWTIKVNETFHYVIETIQSSVKLELNKLKDELELVTKQPNRPQIAFSAKVAYRQSYSDIKPWQTVVFGQVDLNDGQAYSGVTGEFKAPVNGVYVFHVHITGGDNLGLEMVMKKNKQTILLLYINGPGHGTDGGDVAVKLNMGDVIKVEKYGPWGTKPFYIHHIFSFFSGFLLYET